MKHSILTMMPKPAFPRALPMLETKTIYKTDLKRNGFKLAIVASAFLSLVGESYASNGIVAEGDSVDAIVVNAATSGSGHQFFSVVVGSDYNGYQTVCGTPPLRDPSRYSSSISGQPKLGTNE